MRLQAGEFGTLDGEHTMPMEEFAHDGWQINVDPSATRTVYAGATGGAHRCECAYCRNFVAARDRCYSEEFRRLLDKLGVEAHKEAEVSEMGLGASGYRVYSGFYHFVGSVIRDPGDRMSLFGYSPKTVWQVFFTNQRSLAFEAFAPFRLVQLDFTVELPWVLPEAVLV